jgi:PAS domain S-box-containing protein
LDPEQAETRIINQLIDFAGVDVLDVGCGDGLLTWRFAGPARSVLGLDPEARCTWTNARFDALAGLDAGAAAGRGWTEALHPADRQPALEAFHAHAAAGTEFALDVRFARSAGDVVHADVRCAPVHDADGALTAWVAVVTDETARRAAERDLADRRAQLEGIIDASPSAIVLKDPRDRLLLANPAAREMLGPEVGDPLGHPASSFIARDHVQAVQAMDRAVLETGEARQDEIAADDPDGGLRTWLTSRFPVRDADGVLTGVGVIASDITERRRLEREIVRQRELLEEAQDIARLGSWEWDVTRGRFAASGQVGVFAAPSPATPEAVREAVTRIVHPDDLERALAAFEHSRRDVGVQDLTVRITEDGDERVVRLRWRSSVTDDGRTVLLGTAQDVTEEQRREAARRAAEQQLRLIFDHAPIGLALTDLEGRWVRVNPATCTMLGRRAAELLGAPVSAVLHPDDAHVDAEALARVIAGQLDSYEIEKRCLRPDGSRLWVVFSVSAVHGPDGRARQIVLQLLDMTVRRDLEARLTEVADVDAVTGLPNERRLRDELERAITWRRRSGEHATLVLLELEGLAGERDVRELGTLLRRTVRRSDIVVRADGGRFALLLPGTTSAATRAVVVKLEHAIEAAGLPGPPCFGIVELASGGGTPEEVLRQAGAALDAARSG